MAKSAGKIEKLGYIGPSGMKEQRRLQTRSSLAPQSRSLLAENIKIVPSKSVVDPD